MRWSQRRSIGTQHLQAGLVLSLGAGTVLGGLTVVAAEVLIRPPVRRRDGRADDGRRSLLPARRRQRVPVAVLRRRLDSARLGLIDFISTLVRTR